MMPFSELQLALSAVVGGGVGFLSGMLGFGGSFLIVPLLNIALGVPMRLAVGAGACQVLGPATTALLTRGIRREHLKLPLILAGGLFVGVWLGTDTLQKLTRPSAAAGSRGNGVVVETVVLAVYVVVLAGIGLFALWEARRHERNKPLRRGWIAGWRVPPLAMLAGFDSGRLSIPVLSWFGLAVGFVSGLLGISGGIVLLPGLIYLLGMRTQQAVLNSLVILWIVGAQATVAHAWHGNIDLRLVAALLVGGTIGARLGAEVGLRIAGSRLRRGFGWLLLGSAALIAVRLITGEPN